MPRVDTSERVAGLAKKIRPLLATPEGMLKVRAAARAVGLDSLSQFDSDDTQRASQELPRLSERRDWDRRPLTPDEQLALAGMVHDAHFGGTGVELVNPWLADESIDTDPIEWLSNIKADPRILGKLPKSKTNARTGPFPRRVMLLKWWGDSRSWLREGGLNGREWTAITSATERLVPVTGDSKHSTLTVGEEAVWRALDGKAATGAALAKSLNTSPQTIKQHVRGIRAKRGRESIANRSQYGYFRSDAPPDWETQTPKRTRRISPRKGKTG